MSAIDAVKREIASLTPADRAEVARWLEAQEEADWDVQIRRDHGAGKLDALIRNARKEAAAGTLRDLPN